MISEIPDQFPGFSISPHGALPRSYKLIKVEKAKRISCYPKKNRHRVPSSVLQTNLVVVNGKIISKYSSIVENPPILGESMLLNEEE